MKKILLLTVVVMSMFSFTAFAEEVYDVAAEAIECNAEEEIAVDTEEAKKKKETIQLDQIKTFPAYI